MATGFYPTLWNSIKIALRVIWRATRQLFHEATGAIFAIFAVYGGIAAWREWHTRPTAWLLGFAIVYAVTMICFCLHLVSAARGAFDDPTHDRETKKSPAAAKQGRLSRPAFPWTPSSLPPTSTVRPQRDLGFPGEFPFTRGVYPDHVSRPPLDHPPVRRLRQRRRIQPALPLFARARR